MAVHDPGFQAAVTTKARQKSGEDGVPPEERPIAPDQFDPKYETTRWEIIAYYMYYIGNNGLTLFNFAPTAFQNLLSEAAGDAGIIRFAGKDRTVNSIVLICNGISFAIQVVVFLVIGSYAGTSSKFVGRNRNNSGQILDARDQIFLSSSLLWPSV